MSKNRIITVKEREINIASVNEQDYICLTDMAKDQEGDDHIRNWMRKRDTVEFLGLWESLNNPNFKGVEFDTFRKEAGLNSFNLTPKKWIEATEAIGIVSKAGKGGGTYAHKDIAFEFGSWLSPAFKLLIIREFQRLKEEEASRQNLEWDFRRFLSKTNYVIHTDAIKVHLVPLANLPKDKEGIVYASEAEILNYALFNISSKEWKEQNPTLALNKKNIRDYADAHELIVLSNLESINAEMIRAHVSAPDRLKRLRITAIEQLKSLRKSVYTLDKIQSPFLIEHKQKQQNDFDQNLKGLLAVPPPKKNNNKE